MKVIILCALASLATCYHVAPLGKDGVVVDTPEVAAAKLDHYHKLAKAGGAVPHHQHYGYDHHYTPVDDGQRYHGPPAPLGHDGIVADLPEVAHLKAERVAQLSHAFAKAHHVHHLHKRSLYHGPPAPLNHDGTVAETPEVKHAKLIHFAAVSEALANDHHDYAENEVETHQAPYYKYHGPPAPLNHDGTVAETDEVKHAKSVHFAAIAEALARAPSFHHLKKRSAQHYPTLSHDDEHLRYHGPPAPLNHDGTVADTPEVAHLKAERLAQLSHAFAVAPKGPPLNHEGSVDHLPEVKHATAAHLHALYEAFAKAPKGHEQEYHTLHKRSLYHGPPAPLNHDGTVAETPEVKHAKLIHFAAVSEALAKDHHDYAENEVETHQAPYYKYHGPPAPLNHDGTVAETDEVKHAKSVHFAAIAEALARAPFHHLKKRSAQHYPTLSHGDEHLRYHGPPAPLNHDGTVADTPEVAHLKAERLAQLSHAFAVAPKGPPLDHEGNVDHLPEVKHATAAHLHAVYDAYAKAPKGYYEDGHYHKIHKRSYHGPPAPLNHDGTVDETPEVKHLKAAHLAAVAQAISKTPIHYEDNYIEDEKRYHGPPAPLNHDGTVAETPEVKHAKYVHFEAHAKFHGPHFQIEKPLHHKPQSHFIPAPLNHDGTVAETPEVHARRIEHLAAHHKALSHAY